MNDLLGTRGAREWSLLAFLLAEPERIEDAAKHLEPRDFYFNSDRLFGAADYNAGGIREAVFDAIANRGARSAADVERCLSSADNLHGKAVRTDFVAAAIAKLNRRPDINFGCSLSRLVADKEYRAKLAAVTDEGDYEDDIESEPEPPIAQSGPFPTVSMASLAVKPTEPDWIIENLIATEGGAVTGSKPKVGKTTFLADAGVSVTTGTPFLGFFQVLKPCGFFLASSEDSPQALADRFRRVCLARGIDPATVKGFTLTSETPKLDSDKSIRAFANRVGDAGARLAAIDSLYRALRGDAKMLGDEGSQLANVTDAVREVGAKLIVSHHLKKTGTGRPGLESITGAGVGAWCREWLILQPLSAYKPATGERRLRLIAGGSAGNGGEWIIRIREGNLADAGGRVWQTDVRPSGPSVDPDAP